MQGRSDWAQPQWLAVSSPQLFRSVWLAHGLVVVDAVPSQCASQGGQVSPGRQAGQEVVQLGGVVVVPPPELPVPAVGQSHTQGGQTSPGRHAGQAQVHVPPPEPQVGGGGWQSHLHMSQAVPAGQLGQLQAQVPPPPPPSPPIGGGGQSQAHGGQSAPAGQATGQAQAQPVSDRAVQNPPSGAQVAPDGQRAVATAAHMQVESAAQLFSSPWARHGSAAWHTPDGHAPPEGHGSSSANQWHDVSAEQVAWSDLS